MANTELLSTEAPSLMMPYPLVLQAAAGETAFDPVEYDVVDSKVSIPTGIPYSARDFRLMYDAMFSSTGVISGFNITQHGGSGDTSKVDISPGKIVLAGGSGGGKYLAETYSTIAFDMPAAPVSGTVYHRLVAVPQDKADGGDGTYGWKLIGMQGTGGSPPGIPSNGVSLAVIRRTSSGANITSADINVTGESLASGMGRYRASQLVSTSGVTTRITFADIPSGLKELKISWTARTSNGSGPGSPQAATLAVIVDNNDGNLYNNHTVYGSNTNGGAALTQYTTAEKFANLGAAHATGSAGGRYAAGTATICGWNTNHFSGVTQCSYLDPGTLQHTYSGGFLADISGPYSSLTFFFNLYGEFDAGSQIVLTGEY